MDRMTWMFRLTMESDAVCISELRMDRETFRVLCDMISDVGCLKPTRNTSIEEVECGGFGMKIEAKTWLGVFSLSFPLTPLLFILLDAGPSRKGKEKGCLGALDGTLIKVTPPSDEKPRYRTRKGCISTNVLGVCCPNMQFIYVLPGWEGSAHDGRVLRVAISRPHGLRVPQGSYYLVDAGYCNANGFLAPYRGQRYHLKEFSGHRPNTAEEYFNMKHSKARNVIERCFGLLKGRWKILASPSFFSIETQVRIIMACCLLHNLIRKFMSQDPQESVYEETNSEDEKMTTPTCEHERGRGKNKIYWNDEEGEALVNVLQELACDPLWKVDGGFKNGYMIEVHKRHKNATGLWNLKFPYLRKLDLVWGKDRATGLKAEDISQACEDISNNKNVFLCSSDSEGEEESDAQGSPNSSTTITSKKRKKLSPRREIYKNKKSPSLQRTIDTKLDEFNSKFESICGQMMSQYAATANLLADANKSDSLSDEKMEEMMNELLSLGISTSDVGKALEICYNEPTKVKVFFTLPTHMGRSYVLGFLYPVNQ
ncbi:hypothetical protein OSB04_031307 [Centaurea solstitialis]|uniref:DDE Tnp4 domain-containing protein n=1 Tax=Centaurea solstitialis TaxID=347529 RepID=A0AA38S8Q2_9ASTR|nr:hypothetical protein OSB04_031307 [Centaurea solstitialis]